jgi:hypothetical protein
MSAADRDLDDALARAPLNAAVELVEDGVNIAVQVDGVPAVFELIVDPSLPLDLAHSLAENVARRLCRNTEHLPPR